ncbi:MAG: AlpA family phage regulatory protein [Polyangia bacterium]
MHETHRPRILRRRLVQAQTGLSKSAIYDSVAQGIFPRPIHIGQRSVGWLASEVEDWIAACVTESRVGQVKAAVVTARPEASGASMPSNVRRSRARSSLRTTTQPTTRRR